MLWYSPNTSRYLLLAVQDLLYRRLKRLSNYEKANKELDLARARNKDVAISENR